MNQKRLSILICTMAGRKELLSNLMLNLRYQIEAAGAEDVVEILVEPERDITIGAKRNMLVDRATGEYLVFIDDDDQVSPHYISSILKAIESGPDVVTLGVFYNEPNGLTTKWRFSIEHKTMVRQDGVLMIYPTHLCPMKESIARLYKFQNTNIGEDMNWSKAIMGTGMLKSEVFIGDAYHYMFRHSKEVNLDYASNTFLSVCMDYSAGSVDTITNMARERSDDWLNFNVRIPADLDTLSFNALLKAFNRVRVHYDYIEDPGPVGGLENVLRLDFNGDVSSAMPRWDAFIRESYEKYARDNGYVLVFNDGKATVSYSWAVAAKDAIELPKALRDQASRVDYITAASVANGCCIYFSDQILSVTKHELSEKQAKAVDKAVQAYAKSIKKQKSRPQYASSRPIPLRSRYENLLTGDTKFTLVFKKKDREVLNHKDKNAVQISFSEDFMTIGNANYPYEELQINYL